MRDDDAKSLERDIETHDWFWEKLGAEELNEIKIKFDNSLERKSLFNTIINKVIQNDQNTMKHYLYDGLYKSSH